MSSDVGSVAARRQLGGELRRYRKASGLTGQQLATALGWHQSKVSRIEAARNLARLEDVAALADALNLTNANRGELLRLAEASLGAPESRRNSSRAGLTRRQQDFIALEASASVIAHYQPFLLPGYLQTPEYARRVIEMADAKDVERAVEARVSRRRTLTGRDAPRYRIVLMEAALRWRPIDSASMAAQLQDLAKVSTRANVDLRVVTYDQDQAGFIQHPLQILDFRDGADPEALIETTVHDFRVVDERGLSELRRHFERVQGSALSRRRSTAFIKDVARSLG